MHFCNSIAEKKCPFGEGTIWLVLGLVLLLPLVVSGSKKGAHVSVKTSSDGEGPEIPGEEGVV